MKFMVCISMLMIILVFIVGISWADDTGDMNEQVKKLEREIEDLLLQVEILKKRIAELETKAIGAGILDEGQEDNEETGDLEIVKEDIEFLQDQQDDLFARLREMIKLDLYITLEYENFQNRFSRFDARNIELLTSVTMSDRLTAFAEIEFERTAKTSDGPRQGEIEVEQGWLEYSINHYVNPRFGVILVPFGKFNLEHFDPMRDLTDRPIAMRDVFPVTYSEAGAGFVGEGCIGDIFHNESLNSLVINYQVFFINGLTNAITDTGARNARGAFGNDNNDNKALVGRLGIAPGRGIEIGLSGYYGDYDNEGNGIAGYNVDWDFSGKGLELIGEYAYFELDGNGVQEDNLTLVPPTLQGGYIQLNYHFWFNLLDKTFLGRNFDNPTFTAMVRYGQAEIEDDGDDGEGANKEERWTIGVNYRPVETVVFKLEYQFNKSENEPLEYGNDDGFIFSVSGAF